ncbi:MAG: hypothetical protein ACRDA6_03365 [Aeromonas veronii]
MDTIDVKLIDNDVEYWVVRAGHGGALLGSFIESKIVSIAHVDNMVFSDEDLKPENAMRFISNYKHKNNKDGSSSLASVTNRASQLHNFILDMKVGDVVISMDSSRYIIGTVTSPPYKGTNTKFVRDEHGNLIGEQLSHMLRRNVEWTQSSYKRDVPQAIKSSFKANQTVFSMSEHKQSLNHWLSAVFMDSETAYISAKIRQQDDISNFDVAQYSIILNYIEAVACAVADADADFDFSELISNESKLDGFIKKSFDDLSRDRTFDLKTQQAFMSPGDYWGSIKGNDKKVIAFIIAFCVLYGIKPVFSSEDAELVAKDVSEIVSIAVAKIAKDNQFKLVKKGLDAEISKPKSSVNSDTKDNAPSVFQDDVESGFDEI